MIQFLTQHQFGFAVAIYWVFSAAVSALPEPAPYRARASRPEPAPYRARASRPEPAPPSSAGYVWLYRFVHTIAGNLTTAFGSRIPALKVIAGVLLAPLLLATPACALHYAVHPGALNPSDSAAYDLLLIAQDVIDQARTDQLSANEKEGLDTLIAAYNVARESWLTYRDAVSTNAPSDQYAQQLTKNLTDLTNAIKAIRQSAETEVKQ